MPDFSHLDKEGRARMVDVSEKSLTYRTASAECFVQMKEETFQKLLNQEIQKGDVFQVARIAGIMAAKKTSSLIPLCHPLQISSVRVDFENFSKSRKIRVLSEVRCRDKTGVEMEALTACTVAALTIYDMCKALEKGMVISDIRLLEKHGGKSGSYIAEKTKE